MKKVIISICTVLCLLAFPLSAMEWGGLLSNDSGVSIAAPDNDLTFKQSNGISLWFNSPLGEDSGFSLSGETIYKYYLTIMKDVDPQFLQIFDVPLLKVAGDVQAGSGLLSLNAGRFYYVDTSTAVLSQPIDGISVSYNLPVVNFGLLAGYTGLLNSLNVSMTFPSEKDNDIYRMAYPIVPIGASLEFPSFAGNQSFKIDAFYLLDCGSGEDKENLCYANLILSGPITNIVYYNLATSLGFVNFEDMMNYSAFSLMIFPTQLLSINAGVTYGSAEQGPFKQFISVNSSAMAASGKITPSAGFTVTAGNLCFDLNGNFVLAYDGEKYSGTNSDINANFIYNVFSDLQIGLSVNASIDVTGANAHTYGANLNVSLAF